MQRTIEEAFKADLVRQRAERSGSRPAGESGHAAWELHVVEKPAFRISESARQAGDDTRRADLDPTRIDEKARPGRLEQGLAAHPVPQQGDVPPGPLRRQG